MIRLWKVADYSQKSWRCTVNEVRRDSETQRTFMSGATAIITLNAWIGMGLFGMERATSGK